MPAASGVRRGFLADARAPFYPWTEQSGFDGWRAVRATVS